MKWPRIIPAGSIYTYPVSHVDMFATAAASAGHPSQRTGPGALDGVDLIPFLQGRNASVNEVELPHETLYWRSGHYKALLFNNLWKLQVSEIPQKIWLFDMQSDPTERYNLANSDKYADLLLELLNMLHLKDSEQSKPLWPAMSATYIPIDKTWNDRQVVGDEYILWEN